MRSPPGFHVRTTPFGESAKMEWSSVDSAHSWSQTALNPAGRGSMSFICQELLGLFLPRARGKKKVIERIAPERVYIQTAPSQAVFHS